MKVAITGATGFIGNGLTDLLLKQSHSVIALSRDPNRAKSMFGNKIPALRWSTANKEELSKKLDGLDALVNLAGENVGSTLWTKSKRKRIMGSRVDAGKLVNELVQSMNDPPKVLIQASAVGYYGTRAAEILTESSHRGKGFLPEVAAQWEKSTASVEASGVRCVIIRSGVVLSRNGGAFPRLAFPFRLHVGTMFGSGNQWLPWIHYEDEINAIYFLLTNPISSGIYNLVAPDPARMSEVCRQIGPTLFKIPQGLVKLSLGKMGEETILVSQRVLPERLLKEGFQFKFKNIEEAVADIYREKD